MNRPVQIYDTTLRDGAQAEHVSFSLEDKLEIVQRLDDLGVAYIEGGYPASNAKDVEFFLRARFLTLRQSHLVAFGSTRHAQKRVEEDAGLKALVEAGTPTLAIFGKSWDFHVEEALRVSHESNLTMIEESIRYIKAHSTEVFYDAEHFFDGYRANPDYALRTLEAAVRGGADRLVLCDTNGGSLPDHIRRGVEDVIRRFGIPVGIHTHNDAGLAIANALAALEAGADHVQGTINGLGERCGNMDLTTLIPTVQIKLERPCLPQGYIEKLTSTSLFLYDMVDHPPRDDQPYVGRSAFAHKGGMHVSAVSRNPQTYEHVTPKSVGNERRVLVSELSGRSNILAQAKVDLENDRELSERIRDRIQELEALGHHFAAAEASFDLLVLKMAGRYQPFFELQGFRVISEKREDGREITEATLNIRVGDQNEHVAAFGNGPVDAMSQALLKALRPFYPGVEDIRLINFLVRIINPKAATAARVRVMIEYRSSHGHWRTMGVAENIIQASYQALVDGFEFKLLKDRGAI